MNQAQHTRLLLIQLETTLKELKMWASNTPSEEALLSHQPFAMDTLRFEQWLQFIFIPKMTQLIEQQIPLPSTLQLAPYAEEVYKNQEVADLLTIIHSIDQLYN